MAEGEKEPYIASGMEYVVFNGKRKVSFKGFSEKDLKYINYHINRRTGHGISLRRFMYAILELD